MQVKFNHALSQGIRFGSAVLRHLWNVHIAMTVGFVDKRLEVSDLDSLALVVRAVDHRVKPHWVLSIRGQKRLYWRVVKQLLLAETQDSECLLLCDEATLYSQSLVSNLLTTFILELFKFVTLMLFSQKALHLGQTGASVNQSHTLTEIFTE